VQLGHEREIAVDNLSDYPMPRVGFPRTDGATEGWRPPIPCHQTNLAGEMQSDDRVIVTHYGTTARREKRRGACSSGECGLEAEQQHRRRLSVRRETLLSGHRNGVPAGAEGSNARIYDAGQRGETVLGTGGIDGSCVPGKGTFIIRIPTTAESRTSPLS